MNQMTLFALTDMPLVRPGDHLPTLIAEALAGMGASLEDGDIVVIAQKIVSKAENRLVDLAHVQPDARAQQIAEATRKDPRMVAVVLSDSRAVIRAKPGLLVVEQKSGWICANAGVDRSNVGYDPDGAEIVALLPEDADASAAGIREGLRARTGAEVAVLINDSHGRAWRIGTVGTCIGCAGLPPIWDQRGRHDLFGYELVGSDECIADELSAAASLLMGQSDEGTPVVVIRGYCAPDAPAAPATSILRPAQMDAFR